MKRYTTNTLTPFQSTLVIGQLLAWSISFTVTATGHGEFVIMFQTDRDYLVIALPVCGNTLIVG